jgi:hypothetical protein
MDEKELWVAWTRDALTKYEEPAGIDNADELVDDMVELATKYADTMLEEYEKRFSESKRGRKKKPVDDDDDDL